MPYNIDKKKCKQSDGDAGTHVLSYTDGKGKDHENCHTSKKGAQGQIAAIEGDNLAETDDTIEESLVRKYIREKLLLQALTEQTSMDKFKKIYSGAVTAQNIAKLFDFAIQGDADCTDYGTKKQKRRSALKLRPAEDFSALSGDEDAVLSAEMGPVEQGMSPEQVQQCMSEKKLRKALVKDPKLAQVLVKNVGSKGKRKLAFMFVLASGCCNDFESLLEMTGSEMPEEEKLTAILDFVEGNFSKDLFGSSAGKVGSQIKKSLAGVTNRMDPKAFDQARTIIGGKLVEKLNQVDLKAYPGLTKEMISDFREQIKDAPSSQSRGNQTRLGFEGKFDKPIRAALKEITKPPPGGTWDKEVAEALQTGFGRSSGDGGVEVVAIGRRSQNNIWTGGDYPGFLVVPSMLKDFIVDDSGALKFGEDAEVMQRLADNKLIKGVMVVTQTSAGIQNEADAAQDLKDATANGPVTLSIPTGGGGEPLKIQLTGAGHSSSEDEDVKKALAAAKGTTGKDPKPDMFFKIAGEPAPVGVSIKQSNAGSLLSGDSLLRPFVTAAVKISKKNPGFLKALQSGDVKFNLKDMGEVGVDIAYGSIFGGGTNTVKYLVKGDFARAIPKLNPKTGELEYPPNSVKIYADASHNDQGKAAAVDAFAKGEGVYPQIVFRKGEGAKDGKKGRGDDVGGGRNVRPIITYETRGGATDLSGDVTGEKDWQDAAKEVLSKIGQAPPKKTNESTVITKSQVRSLIRQRLMEDLSRADRKEIERMFKRSLTKADTRKILNKEIEKTAGKMIKKELDSTDTRKMIDKSFKKQFDKELQTALGSSFFGTPGKINKFVIDEIHNEVEKMLGNTATRELVVQICKDVIIKLYRELSFSYQPVIQRLKV